MCQLWACPEQETVVMIERCGKFDRVGLAGFNCVCCCIGEATTGKLSLRVQQLDVKCETKTRDNVFCTVVISVQYQVQRDAAYDAYYKLTDSRQQISSYVFDVVRAAVPSLNLDDVFLEKEQIAKSIKEELTKSMGGYGYTILHALVNDIVPAAKVKEAMNEINAARRLRTAAVEKAEALKVSVVKAAEAESEAKYLQGQGIARQRQAIITGLRDSVTDFSSTVSGISAKDVIELMLITQYFDTLRDVGANSKTNAVFIPHSPAGLNDMSSQIRNAFIQGHAASQ
jgi:regulator of protease activity HflC (stomatin/prohibitin superfamily)